MQCSKIDKISIVRSGALNAGFSFALFQSQLLVQCLLEIRMQRKGKNHVVNADNIDNIDSKGCEGCGDF